MALNVKGFLRGLPAFKSFSDEELHVLTGVLRAKQVDADQQLFKTGSPGVACFIVMEGKLRQQMERLGSLHTLSLHGPGDLLGHIELLDHGRRSASCVAVEASTVLELHRNEFDMLVGTASSLGFRFLDLLTSLVVTQLRAANEQLTGLASKEHRAARPRSPNDPAVQDVFKNVTKQTSSASLDAIDLLEDVEVVIPDAEKYKHWKPR